MAHETTTLRRPGTLGLLTLAVWCWLSSPCPLSASAEVDQPLGTAPTAAPAVAAPQPVEGEQLQALVEHYLHAQSQRLPQDAQIRFTPERLPQTCVLPPGEVVWDIRPSSPTVFNSSSFALIARIDGRTVCNLVVRGKVEAMAPVAMAIRTLQRGESFTPGDIRMSQQDLLRQRQPFLRADELIGRIATRTVTAGVVIEARDVASAPVIKKGEVVKLMTGGAAFQLSTTAVAIADGAEDGLIAVRNLNSNKVVHARVFGPGLVTVEH